MAVTQVQVANLALARVGVRDQIVALNDPGANAQMINSIYALVEGEVLESFPWPWAEQHQPLKDLIGNIPDAATPIRKFVRISGWAYCYQLPVDCILAKYIWTGVRTPLPDARIPFTVEAFPGPPQWDSTVTYAKDQWVVLPGAVNAISLQDGNIAHGVVDGVWWAAQGGIPAVGTQVLLTDQQNAELLYTCRPTATIGYPPLFASALAWKLAAELGMGLGIKEALQDRCLKMYQLARATAAAVEVSEAQEVEPDSEVITGRE